MAIHMGTLEAGADLATPGPGRGVGGPVGLVAGSGRAARINGRAAPLPQEASAPPGRASGGPGRGRPQAGGKRLGVAIVNIDRRNRDCRPWRGVRQAESWPGVKYSRRLTIDTGKPMIRHDSQPLTQGA
jgi:hypothetical protein